MVEGAAKFGDAEGLLQHGEDVERFGFLHGDIGSHAGKDDDGEVEADLPEMFGNLDAVFFAEAIVEHEDVNVFLTDEVSDAVGGFP